MIRRLIATYCRKKSASWRRLAEMEAGCQALAIIGGDELGRVEFAKFMEKSKRAAERWERWAERWTA